MQQSKVKTSEAVVTGKSGNKSIKVSMDYMFKHPKYGKFMKRHIRLVIHDERNEANVGDIVEIAECRPYSKKKSWRLVNILKKAVSEQPR